MHLIAHLIHEHGLIAVATIVALECVGFPVPGETALLGYVGLSEGRIKLAQYLFLRHGGKIIFVSQFVPLLRSFAGLFAGANVMPLRNFLFANAISSSVWAMSYGYAAYWAGREFEHSHRHVAIFLVIIAVIVIIAAGIFVHRREAELIAEAERAMPGPLKSRQ
jgi:membrane protein DedA with SNARE-associated domain